MLARGPLTPQEVLGLILLAYAIQEMFVLFLLPEMRAGQSPALTWHLERVFFAVMEFAVTVGLVFGVGRMFGGKGNVADCVTGIAWFNLITSFLVPLTAPALPGLFTGEITAAAALLLFAGTAIFCWVFAGVIAGIHRFRSTGSVLMAMMVLITLTTLIASALAPAG
ncbi:hypothetical protein LNKW23_28000 [Paralimibaculum aggregatum]|uniref:Yip1 domain-containing protein n=1 Tax=Paralimibaculum aggregatum TaxID=3036245 RepID=A0ABQ6LPC2_9RHOB|nr:hypothetical protein LNKW23_28000 [Limibaculum sp. NKW23]